MKESVQITLTFINVYVNQINLFIFYYLSYKTFFINKFIFINLNLFHIKIIKNLLFNKYILLNIKK